jgi:3-oxoisoapionate kinase
MNADTLPAPWVTWFGDDFTGAAAVMEVLTFAGVPSVLFTDMPTRAALARFAGCRGIGIASTARSQSPAWMQQNLPAPLTMLHRLGAPILHYKICSTFDSAPEVGNIGTAIDLALAVRPAPAVPILTAAPQMRRYQSFGHLFAGTFDGVFRLDRHPVMSRHPVTPMAEADLMRHLAGQSARPSALIDLEALWSGQAQQRLDACLRDGAGIVSLDSIDPATEAAAGRLIWENRDRLGLVFGSQGVEYALVRHWQATGLIPPPAPVPGAGMVGQIAAVSGSVSPMTAEQLDWAGQNGFARITFDAASVCGPADAQAAEEARCVDLALRAAGTGSSPLVQSAAGPDDPAVARFRSALGHSGLGPDAANQRIGAALGRILDRVLRGSTLRRAVISGGDTSGQGMRHLGLEALVALAPTLPGAALCTAHGSGPHDGLQIVLKGGQMGSRDFFGWIRDGGGAR